MKEHVGEYEKTLCRQEKTNSGEKWFLQMSSLILLKAELENKEK